MDIERQPLEYYLSLDYPYTVVPDEESFFIEFPDLPGCMTQVEDKQEVVEAAEDIRTLWIEGEYEDGNDIPEPLDAEYSGKFVTRVPKSLHKNLARAAKREGMSLNAYVCYLLSEQNASARINQQLTRIESHFWSMNNHMSYSVDVEQSQQVEPRTSLKGRTKMYKVVAA